MMAVAHQTSSEADDRGIPPIRVDSIYGGGQAILNYLGIIRKEIMKLVITLLAACASLACVHAQYAFTNFVGLPGSSGTNDATGTAARFTHPYGVALDSTGNLYVADTENHTVRKITPSGA